MDKEIEYFAKAQVIFSIDNKTDENYNCDYDYSEKEKRIYLTGKIDAYNSIITFINHKRNNNGT